jgi:hypothetical protein
LQARHASIWNRDWAFSPSIRQTAHFCAAKWKGKPDAEAKLVDFVTKSPKVKLEDGTEEEHKAVASKDMGEIKNLVGWVLSQ